MLEAIFIALFGISIGSFLNVVIYRLPKNESIVLPASHCSKCKVPLKFYHNIPIFSWFYLKGKCAYCNSKISIQYPLIEFGIGVLSLAIYFHDGFNYSSILFFAVFTILTALSVIDLKYKEIPDSLNLLALTLGIIATLEINTVLDAFQNALIFSGAFSLLRFYVSFFVGREAMGEGDIMIAGTIGAVAGVYLGVITIFLSAVISIIAIVLIKERELPFVPFLSLALLISYFFKPELIKFTQNFIFFLS